MLIALRLTRVAVHVVAGFAAALGLARLPGPLRRRFLRWWARRLLAVLGIRVRVSGVVATRPALIVANHVSWLDVIAIAAAQPALFVCKSEVARWPGLGWLLGRAGTIFIRRGSFRDVWRVNHQLRARFDASHSVAVFPEGTTTCGADVLAFRPALFQPAVERGLPVQPVAIAYSSEAAAYVGETSFIESLINIAGARRLEVRIALLPPLRSTGLTRRQAAAQARGLIRAQLAQRPLVEDGPFEVLDLHPQRAAAAVDLR